MSAGDLFVYQGDRECEESAACKRQPFDVRERPICMSRGPNMSSTNPASASVSDQSIGWFVRLRAEDVTQEERDLFFGWLRAAREHQQAFVETLQLWESVAVVKQMNFDELKPFPQVWEYKKRLETSIAL